MDYNKSEFSVSETTAKWVRLQRALNKVWGDFLDMEDSGLPDEDKNELDDAFSRVDKLLLNSVSRSIYEVTNMTNAPANMI